MDPSPDAVAGGASDAASRFTGRIGAGPTALLRDEVLRPQLEFEAAHLLPAYLRIERVLLLEYHRMGLLDDADVADVNRALDGLDEATVRADADAAMTDIAFTVERHVLDVLDDPPPRWHVDRSRNDLQATAQVMHTRDRLLSLVDDLIGLAGAAHRLACREETTVMPGYTHSQPAQIASGGFYFSAMTAEVLHSVERFSAVFATLDSCPLGAGAMTGGELAWDRTRMARLLGFGTGDGHAMVGVAGRDHALEATAELCLLGVTLSRFVTDLITWGGAGYGFVDLPDEWSGISSAMPQKKNFPILERLRGRTAGLVAGFVGVAVGQRATPFANSVEVSKEAGAHVPRTFDQASSTLRLFSAVLDGLRLRTDRLREACDTEHLGGFTLANRLCLEAGIPWRTAQVLVGRYIVAATAAGRGPRDPDPELLVRTCAREGHRVDDAERLLTGAFAVDGALSAKRTAGSAGPDSVREMLQDQAGQLERLTLRWEDRRRGIRRDQEHADRLLSTVAAGAADRRPAPESVTTASQGERS